MAREQENTYERLKDRLAMISDLRSTKSLLFWDQQTYMPKGGVTGRAEQVATLSRLAHEMITDDETKRLLDASGEPNLSSEEGALVRRARRDHERATKLPAELVAETSRVTSPAEPVWVRAREESDWSLFAHTWRRSWLSSVRQQRLWATRIIPTTPFWTPTNRG
jgi:carboxypeptidase Taq